MDLDTAKVASRRLLGHAPFVGLVAMHFNVTEQRFHFLISCVLGVSLRSGASLASQGGVQALADMLKATARREGREDAIFALAYAVRLFDACRVNRNLIVHGIYGNPSFAPQEVLLLRKTSPKAGMKPGDWSISVTELEQAVVDILAAGNYFKALAYAIDDADLASWPETPPMPRRLPDTLAPYNVPA